MTPVPIPMQGLGQCSKERLCGYHAPKVHPEFGGTMGSVFPTESVWGGKHLAHIAQRVYESKQNNSYQEAPLGQKINVVLNAVNTYWAEHTLDLDGAVHKNWEAWNTGAKNSGRYAAGGWAASAQQVSQYVESVKVLRKDGGVAFDQTLRIGTASGVHTQEEVFVLALGGVKKPKLYIVDICLPPLVESEVFVRASVGGTIQGSFFDLNRLMNNTWPVITAHFVESFIPTQEQFNAEYMSREEALALKHKLFHKIYELLSPGGVMISAIGISPDQRRFHTDGELMHALVQAGFSENHVIVVPTTDPFDYENGHHISGNYFVVSLKENKQSK